MFLIKLRECLPQIASNVSLNAWYSHLTEAKKNLLNPEEEKLLLDVIFSQFNLIIDKNIKSKIIKVIQELNEESLDQIILKSYLYLIIGNTARSDNLLKNFFLTRPFENWKRKNNLKSKYSQIIKNNFGQILKKIKNHPSDRAYFQYFCEYLYTFYTLEDFYGVNQFCSGIDNFEKINNEYSRNIFFPFSNYLSFDFFNQDKKIEFLLEEFKKDKDIFFSWYWPLWTEINYFRPEVLDELNQIEKKDEFFVIFILNNNLLIDLYTQRFKKSSIYGRVSLLKKYFENRSTAMLSLYKLLESGYVDSYLVDYMSRYLIDE